MVLDNNFWNKGVTGEKPLMFCRSRWDAYTHKFSCRSEIIEGVKSKKSTFSAIWKLWIFFQKFINQYFSWMDLHEIWHTYRTEDALYEGWSKSLATKAFIKQQEMRTENRVLHSLKVYAALHPHHPCLEALSVLGSGDTFKYWKHWSCLVFDTRKWPSSDGFFNFWKEPKVARGQVR